MDYISSKYGQGMVAFWNKFEIDNLEEKLYNDINPEKHGEIGIVIKDDLSSSRHRYMLGVVSQNKDGPISWMGHQIAGGKYAVITTPPVDMTICEDEFVLMIKNVWIYIVDQWFDITEYKYDETRNDFEYYDERCHYCKDSVMEIYIPIK